MVVGGRLVPEEVSSEEVAEAVTVGRRIPLQAEYQAEGGEAKIRSGVY